jgi:hypothetical protein
VDHAEQWDALKRQSADVEDVTYRTQMAVRMTNPHENGPRASSQCVEENGFSLYIHSSLSCGMPPTTTHARTHARARTHTHTHTHA